MHQLTFHTFQEGQQQVYYKLRFPQEIDFDKDAFTISVCQQGPRLEQRNQRDFWGEPLFKPTSMNVLLGRMDGMYIKGQFGNDFTYSLDNEGMFLNNGEYYLMIDPVWNNQAATNKDYKNIVIDIYSS